MRRFVVKYKLLKLTVPFVLIVILDGCASTTKISNSNQIATQESLHQLVDQQEILNLISQYSYSWNSKQLDQFAAIFLKMLLGNGGPQEHKKPR
jgi:hypothetical protein